MGMYIAFSKTEKQEDIFYTVRVSRDIFREIASLSTRSFEDAEKLLPIKTADLLYIEEDLLKQKARTKERIALELIKKDFDAVDLQGDIEYYEDTILELGMLHLLIDMCNENDDKLYIGF